MSEDMIGAKEFTCPRCGSHEFGTTSITVNALRAWPGDAEGMCHGYVDNRPCNFIWRRADDALYFKGTGRFYPRTVTAVAR